MDTMNPMNSTPPTQPPVGSHPPKPEPILSEAQVIELTNRAIQIFDAGGAARRFPDRQSWIDFCIGTAEKHVVEDGV